MPEQPNDSADPITSYPVADEDLKRLDNNFTYHAPKADQPARYTALRNHGKDLAYHFLAACPPSRERSLALTHLEEALFWANAAIARNE